MYKPNLERVIRNASEIYIKPGDILITADGHYIDKRTKLDLKTNRLIVNPVAYQINHNMEIYWYVCPDCQELHISNPNEIGEINPMCCVNKNCERHQYSHGKHFLIKRSPIILDDSMSSL